MQNAVKLMVVKNREALPHDEDILDLSKKYHRD